MCVRRFDRYLDFTTDPAAYPSAAMAAWVETLHNTYGQHYMHIIDPGISSTQGSGVYPPWDEGLQAGIFINDTNGNVLIGKVWPGLTVRSLATQSTRRHVATHIMHVASLLQSTIIIACPRMYAGLPRLPAPQRQCLVAGAVRALHADHPDRWCLDR